MASLGVPIWETKITRLKASLYKHELRLRTPYNWANGCSTSKQGFFVVLESSNARGIGEYSPIPGAAIDWDLVAAEFIKILSALRLEADDLFAEIDSFDPSARVRCAITTAWADFKSAERGKSLAEFLGRSVSRTPAAKVPVNGLLTLDSQDTLLQKVREFEEQGIDTIKVKCSHDTRQVERVLGAIRACFPALKIRLDPNESWSGDVLRIIQALERFDIQYIEQPMSVNSSLEDHRALRLDSPVRIALDQSITGLDAALKIIDYGAADRLILKAPRLGGPDRVLEVMRACEGADIPVTVTAGLESMVGIRLAASLASLQHSPIPAAGLLLWPLFVDNFGTIPEVKNGAIEVSSIEL